MKKLLVIATILFISGCGFTARNTPAATPTPHTEARVIDEDGYRIGYKDIISPEGTSNGHTLELRSPEGATKTLSSALQQKIEANDARFSSFSMPINPTNKNITYLSTYRTTNDSGTEVTSKIYSLNLTNDKLTEIYTFQSSRGILYRTIGREGNKIILMEDGVDNSPGPCGSIWSDYTNQIKYLDITDLNAGFQKFDVPAEKIAEGKQETEKCAQEMEASGSN